MIVRIDGNFDEVQRSINAAIKDVESASQEMITVMLQAVAANTMPYVPVDTSALINSEYRSVKKTRNGVEGIIGYGAPGATGASGTPVQEYAIYVHNGPQKNWQKPGASNRFLEKGVEDFIAYDLSSIIARYT